MKKEEIGITKEEMTSKELKELSVGLGVLSADAVKSMKKQDIIDVIDVWEREEIARREAEKSASVGIQVETKDDNDLGYHEGKKIVSSKEVELNGKKYNEIVNEDGVTFKILK